MAERENLLKIKRNKRFVFGIEETDNDKRMLYESHRKESDWKFSFSNFY